MSKRVNIEHDRWWMVRAGDDGALFHHVRRNEVVAIGGSIPTVDLTGELDTDALRERFMSVSGGAPFLESPRFLEVADFVVNIQAGDIVVTPSAAMSEVLIRTVVGVPEFHADDRHGLHLQRRVRAGQRRALTTPARELLARVPADVFRLGEDSVAALRELVRPSRAGG